jgi:hypothetical protein
LRRRFEVLRRFEVWWEVWWSGAIFFGTLQLRGRSRIRVVEWCVRIKGLLKGLMVLRVRIQKYISSVHILLMKIKSPKRLFRMSGL